MGFQIKGLVFSSQVSYFVIFESSPTSHQNYRSTEQVQIAAKSEKK